MVESKEVAVLFKRNKTENGNLELIPYKVIEGNYYQDDEWFVDDKNIGYPHLTSYRETGICYGMRIEIDDAIKKYLNEKEPNTKTPLEDSKKKILLSLIKKKILLFAKKYTYIKDVETIGNVITIDKQTKKTIPYKDIDTMINEEKYEKLLCFVKDKYENKVIENQQDYISTSDSLNIKMSPYELSQKIKEVVKGQDEQIDTIVINLYLSLNYKHINKKGIILVGPSGVGKTLILKTISDILNIPVCIFSAAGLSQSGYIGRKTEDILSEIIINSNFDLEKAQNSIVFLDEIDKLADTGQKSDVATSAVQNELLRIIEGDRRSVTINNKTYQIDTTNIYFCAAGAFSQIFEDKLSENKLSLGFNTTTKKSDEFKITTDILNKYGMKNELLGRLPIIVELNDLDKETLKEILLSKNGEFVKIIDLLSTLGISCPNIHSLVDFIVDDAINKKIGARGLNITINKIFSKILFKVFSEPEKYSEIYFNENILINPNDYILVERKVKQLKRSIQEI